MSQISNEEEGSTWVHSREELTMELINLNSNLLIEISDGEDSK